MASSTKNVKLGVCRVFFAGVDLGYTQGGVEVTVKSDTHKVNIDQFGKTTVNETILSRDVMAKVPLAETTLENLVGIMPGSSIIQSGGTVASGSLVIATNPTAGTTINVNGVTVTFRSTLTGVGVEALIGATVAATASNLAAALNASLNPAIAQATYVAAGSNVNIKFGNALVYGFTGKQSAEGNSFHYTGTGTSVTPAVQTFLTGGVNATNVRVDSATGVGVSLLDVAKELRLHPTIKADTDYSDDFIIPYAATPGGLSFSYKIDAERIYSVEFNGYPDPDTGRLFAVGAAVV